MYKSKLRCKTLFYNAIGDRGGTRTHDRLIRNQLLYPAELLDLSFHRPGGCAGRFLFFRYVGVTGFEPVTSCSQSRRDDRTTLHPGTLLAVRGGFEPPVRKPVRQFSKLLVSATHPSHRIISQMSAAGRCEGLPQAFYACANIGAFSHLAKQNAQKIPRLRLCF